MGQPAHALSAHAGHSQLWAWASFTKASSLYSGAFAHRLFLAYKYLTLFLTIPFFIPHHPWASSFTFHTKGLTRFRSVTLYNPTPNFKERPYLWSRLHRLLPRRVLFKDGDQDVWQDAIQEERSWGKRVWGQIKTFNLAGTTVFVIQGLALFGQLSTPTSVEHISPRSLRPLWRKSFEKTPYLLTRSVSVGQTPLHKSRLARPPFWL